MTLGERIRAVRLAHGMTQKQLGAAVGMADSAIRKYESGKNMPRLSTLVRLATAMGVTIADITEPGYWSKVPDAETQAALSDKPETEVLLSYFTTLNLEGRDKVISYAKDLAGIMKYRREGQGNAEV